ncbi:MAG: MMPL family transporter, partial [Planctomycetota bacterium]
KAVNKIVSKEKAETKRKFYVAGKPIIHYENNASIFREAIRFMFLDSVLIFVFLFLIFRRLPEVIISFLPVSITVIWTLGIASLFNITFTSVGTILGPIIMIAGVGDAMHIISHYLQEKQNLQDNTKAVLKTIAKAGGPCFFTSLTTAIGFSSLLISDIAPVRETGLLLAFGVITAYLITMLLIPNILLIIPVKAKKLYQNKIFNFTDRLLNRIGDLNLRKGNMIIALSFIITALFAVGLFKINVRLKFVDNFKKHSSIKKSYNFVDKNLSGAETIEIVIKGKEDSFKNPENLLIIERLDKLLVSKKYITVVNSINDYLKLINKALHEDNDEYYKIPDTKNSIAQSLLLYEMSGGEKIKDYLTEDYSTARISARTTGIPYKEFNILKKEIAEHFQETFSVNITGTIQIWKTLSSNFVSSLVKSFTLSFLIIFGIMSLIFGWKAGILSIVPNIFPIIISMGLMGFVKIDLNLATATIAAVILGIVVDDTIHYFTHFRHELLYSSNHEEAMKKALFSVGKAMIFTSIILSSGFFVFIFSETTNATFFGVLSSIGIIAALICDLFVGPVLLVKFKVFKASLKKNNQ